LHEESEDDCNWYCSLVGKVLLKLRNIEEPEGGADSTIISELEELLQL